MAKQQGVDPVQAALERVRQKQASNATPQIKTITNDKGEILPDNSDIMAARKARRLAKQAQTQTGPTATATTDKENKQAAIAAAIARAKAKKAQQAENSNSAATSSSVTAESSADTDPRKAAIAAAIARAKAKKSAASGKTAIVLPNLLQQQLKTARIPIRVKPLSLLPLPELKRKKRSKRKNSNNAVESSSAATESSADTDPRKAVIAARHCQS